MRLTDILTEKRIKMPLVATTKEGAIQELVNLLADNGDLYDRDKALAAVMEREHTRTTGIGNGLAIPHGKANVTNELVMAIGRPATPVNFDSIDQKPVSLVLLLISPMDQTGPHIQALAHISRLMSIDSFRNKLLGASCGAEMFKIIQTQEAAEM